MFNNGNEFQSAKTHCPRGHAYTPENTKLCKSTKPGHFKRQCRACKKDLSDRTLTRERLIKAIEADDANAEASSQVLQTLEAIRAQELAARADRKAANAAARKIRHAAARLERNREQREARAALDPLGEGRRKQRKARDQARQARRDQVHATAGTAIDQDVTASDPVENIDMAIMQHVAMPASVLAQIAGGVEHAVRADYVESQVQEVDATPPAAVARDLAPVGSDQVHDLGPIAEPPAAIDAPADVDTMEAPPIAPPRRPRRFMRLAIRFVRWRAEQEEQEHDRAMSRTRFAGIDRDEAEHAEPRQRSPRAPAPRPRPSRAPAPQASSPPEPTRGPAAAVRGPAPKSGYAGVHWDKSRQNWKAHMLNGSGTRQYVGSFADPAAAAAAIEEARAGRRPQKYARRNGSRSFGSGSRFW